jgi:hypothetical protein
MDNLAGVVALGEDVPQPIPHNNKNKACAELGNVCS